MTSCRRNRLDLQFKPKKKLADNRLPSAPDVTKELYQCKNVVVQC